jgi:hypothetical protein
MGRKVSIGVAGTGGGIGTIVASGAGNTLTTAVTNQNLIIDPNGTGTVETLANFNLTGDLSIANQGDLRLLEASAGGTNYIAMQAASAMAANYTITWPSAVSGTSGFVLSSDTSGNLSWSSAGGNIPVSDSTSTATVHYPFFGTASGSIPTTLTPLVRSNLAFVPSTGELLHPILSGASSNSATLTIRGTSSATKAAASVLMTDNVTASSTTTGTLVVTGGVGISGAVYAASGVIAGTLNSLYTENTTTSSKSFELADRNKVISCTNTSPITITVPTNSSVAFPIGSVVYVYRNGTGTVTIAAAGGVTLNKTGTMNLGEEFYCRKRADNEWVIVDSPTVLGLAGSGGTLSAASGYNQHTYTSGGQTTFVVP